MAQDERQIALVIMEGCGFCEEAVEKYKKHIEGGYIGIIDLDTFLDEFEDAVKCLCDDHGCSVPQLAVLEGHRAVTCVPALRDFVDPVQLKEVK